MLTNEKEILIFVKTGKEKFIKEVEFEYVKQGYTINTYLSNSNKYLINAFSIKKLPTAVIMVGGEEVNRI